MTRKWNGGLHVGYIIMLANDDEQRLSSSNRLSIKDGDRALCVAHSGDYFCDYRMLERLPDGTYRLGQEFCAYECGTPNVKVDSRSFHLLMAGEAVSI